MNKELNKVRTIFRDIKKELSENNSVAVKCDEGIEIIRSLKERIHDLEHELYTTQCRVGN
jgi:hypothetical protein